MLSGTSDLTAPCDIVTAEAHGLLWHAPDELQWVLLAVRNAQPTCRRVLLRVASGMVFTVA